MYETRSDSVRFERYRMLNGGVGAVAIATRLSLRASSLMIAAGPRLGPRLSPRLSLDKGADGPDTRPRLIRHERGGARKSCQFSSKKRAFTCVAVLTPGADLSCAVHGTKEHLCASETRVLASWCC